MIDSVGWMIKCRRINVTVNGNVNEKIERGCLRKGRKGKQDLKQNVMSYFVWRRGAVSAFVSGLGVFPGSTFFSNN